ncbi:hypothetical protein SELMODRAFT_424417 [Selaginella moellendorffii]|uniref:Uncharacterized protein n=1 Tax=Selaginella moellendorffii TaxID=88036 RepID=D8SPU0_SELML|nr:hypothetical protein SELMODRAFT_424417 [Selaginella moellendorffii]
MGLTPALLRELSMKKFMKKTKYLQWEEDKQMEGHRHRIRSMKPAVDNQLPDQGPRKALEQKKERLWQNRFHQIDMDNLWFLTRLRDIKNRKPGSMWRRKSTGLMRGEAFKLKEPSVKRHKIQGKLDPPFQSTKKVQDRVVRNAVEFQGMDEEGERWLRRWMSKDKDVPIDILDYAKSSPLPSVRTTPRSKAVTPPPRGKKKPEPFIEPEAEDLAPRAAKLSLKDQQTATSPRTPLWQWDVTDQTPPSSSRWSSPPTSTRFTTPPSSHRWSMRS